MSTEDKKTKITSEEPRTLSEQLSILSEKEMFSVLSQEVFAEKNMKAVWSLNQIGLLQLLKALSYEMRTACITLQHGFGPRTVESRVALIGGEIVFAQHEETKGKDALFLLARVKQGTFNVSNDLIDETNIEGSSERILVELSDFLNSDETAVLSSKAKKESSQKASDVERSISATALRATGETVLNRYRVVRELGKGGMGAVLLGRDDLSGQQVAIKVLPESLADDEKAVARFDREAQALARLDHPNIVPLLTYAVDGNKRFIVMKYVSGDTLQNRIETNRMLSFSECRIVLSALLDGLHYAHQHDVIHRDIKPGNILMTDDGRVYLADFGIAKMQTDLRLTRPDMVVGSPQYMSPEQVTGKEVSPATDLYSCGLILFEMLAGRPPFTATAEFSVMRMQLESDPPSPSKMRGEQIPMDLLYLMAQLLKKKPSQRPDDALNAKALLGSDTHTDKTELETIRSFTGEAEYRELGAFDEETEDLKPDSAFEEHEAAKKDEGNPSVSQDDVQVLDVEGSYRTRETSNSSILQQQKYKQPRVYMAAAFVFSLGLLLLFWGVSPSGDDSKSISKAIPMAPQKQDQTDASKAAGDDSKAKQSPSLTEEAASKATVLKSDEKTLTVDEKNANAANEPGSSRKKPSKNVVQRKKGKRQASKAKSMALAKAELKKLQGEASQKGVLRSDSQKYSEYISQIRKEIARKKEPAALKTVKSARNYLRTIKIDRAFVDRKLQRFNRQYGQIADQRKRKVVDKRFVHVINAMTAGNYKKANVELNRCFAELR